MKIKLRCHDGIIQTYNINPKNLNRLLKKNNYVVEE